MLKIENEQMDGRTEPWATSGQQHSVVFNASEGTEQESERGRTNGANDGLVSFLTQLKAALSQSQEESRTLRCELEAQKEQNRTLRTQLNQQARKNAKLIFKLT